MIHQGYPNAAATQQGRNFFTLPRGQWLAVPDLPVPTTFEELAARTQVFAPAQPSGVGVLSARARVNVTTISATMIVAPARTLTRPA